MTSIHKPAIWTIILSCLLFELQATCLKTTCDCYEDEYTGLLEYQCPNKVNTKLVFRIEDIQKIKIICMDRISIDRSLPNHTFSFDHVTIENCEISRSLASILNITSVKNLKIDDSVLREDFKHFLSSTLFSRLERISFRATYFENLSLQSIEAPNLFFVDFEEMDYHVASKTVNNLTQLEILNFLNNEINIVKDGMLKNLLNLKELHMMFNAIEKIYDNAFEDLANLRILNLANNNIRFVNRNVLNPLQSLNHVILEGNYGLELDDYLFANFTNLSIVQLGGSDINSIPEKIFSGSTNISEISLDNNNISIIPRGLFQGLKNLKIVDLKFNKIKSINGVFQDLDKLQILLLNNNEISSVDSTDFFGLSSLVDLNLEYNNIHFIHENAFKTNINLETVDFSHNKYEYEVNTGKVFTSIPFSNCKNLKSLDLSYNLLKDVPDDIFFNAKFLEHLDLEGNRIEVLDLEDIHKWNIAFRGATINLEKNNITHFFFDDSAIEKTDPDYEMILQELEFDGNIKNENINTRKKGHDSILKISQTIECDCKVEPLSEFTRKEDTGIFLDLNRLLCDGPVEMEGRKFLDIPASELTCNLSSITEEYECTNFNNCSCLWRPIDKTIIVNCTSMNIMRSPVINAPTDIVYQNIEVHLEDNMLTEFSQVEGYENVTSIFLCSNYINNVSWIPRNIEYIDLSYNSIKTLERSILERLSENSVKNITLGWNPWLCDCNEYGMTDFLRKHSRKIDVSNIKCAASGLTMHSLNKEDVCHEIPLYVFILLVFFCPTLLSLVLLILYYKYKQEIRIWLFSHNLCTRFLSEDDMDQDKPYDIFVSYSQKDAEFVEKTLVPILEDNPYNYKLCLHYRDWIPGSFITENIVNSVTKSRRTLIVLTPNFLDSIWGKMEFRTAHAEAMKERRNRVILLLKDNIDVEKLDDELRSYVATNTYLKWNDPWFWKKLRYAMPHVEEKH